MTGKDFVSLLVDQLKLKIPPVTKSQWSQKQTVSLTILRNAFNMFERQKFYAAIVPIVEFHELSLNHGHTTDSFANRINNPRIVEKMRREDSIGIYAFFDSSGRVIYIGKTEKKTFFSEMEQRYRNKSVSGRIIKTGRSSPSDAKVNDVARYISAYKIEKHLISNVEALLTRVIINNASNIRVESFYKP